MIATQTDTPFGLELKAGDVPDRSVLEIRVYNESGDRVKSQSFGFASQVAVDINGKSQSFEQPPVIIEDNTMAPLRAIFEAMGATVTYEQATQTVTARKGDLTVSLVIGQSMIKVNGVAKELEVPAQLVNGYTLAPARFVGETFGGKVEWEGSTRTVEITTK
ncbi:hypothetical protein D3C73_1054910 [compost metagenome]